MLHSAENVQTHADLLVKQRASKKGFEQKITISTALNVLLVGCKMCKQAGASERTGVFSCLVIKPSQTFALLLTHTDSQTLFPQKPTNIAPTPTGRNAPLRELCALRWCVCVCVLDVCMCLYLFLPVCVCVSMIGGAYKFDLPPSSRLPAVKDL